MLAIAAMFIAAGGFIHLREWLDTYRHVPPDVAGAAVVRVGFPANAVTSLIVAAALAICAWRKSRFAPQVVLAAVVFQLGSLAALIATRTDSLFGWAEPTWTLGANQSRAVEIGALLSLAAVAVIAAQQRRNERQALVPLPATPGG